MAVGVVALAVRLLYLWELRGFDALSILVGDARSYHEWALRIVAGDWVGTETFYQAPLYPYFMAAVYAVFGPSLFALRLVQACLGAASCALVAAAGTYLFRRGPAVLAGLLLALYPAAIFSDLLVQKSVLDLLLMAGLLLVLARESRSRRPAWWLGVGLSLGLLCLTRENAIVLILPLGVWALRRRRAAGTTRFAPAALFAAGLAAALGPVMLRNAAVGGDFVLTTAQLGPNLYMGNNPAADGTYQPLVPGHADAFYEAADARQLAEQDAGRRLSSSEVSRYWAGKAFEYVRAAPGAWLGLMGRKVMLLVNAAEIGDVDMPYVYAEWSRLLRGLLAVFHFGVLFPLAGLGFALSWRHWRRLWIFPLLLGLYGATVVSFYVMGRYRLPAVPVLLLFVAAGLSKVPGRLFRDRRPAAAAACCVALALAVVSNWCLFPDLRLSQIVVMESNLGVGLARDPERRDQALPHLRRAMELAPGFVEPKKRMGLLLLDLGRPDEAARYLADALKLETGDPDTYIGLGRAAEAGNRWAEALGWYRKALSINPNLPAVELQAGHCLMYLERVPEALEHFSRAARLAPNAAEARFFFGWALGINGSLPDAARELQAAIALAPAAPEPYVKLSEIYRLQGRLEESRRYAATADQLARSQGAPPRALP